MRALALVLLLTASLGAGCMNDAEPSTGDDNDGDTDAGATNQTTSVPMDFPTAGPGPLDPEGATFDVGANATAVLIEARWECTSPTCEIAIAVVDANGTEVASGSGSGEADLSVESPAEGTYTIQFSSDAPVAGVSGEARVTVFEGDVPTGFSAWEDDEATRDR